MSSSDTAPPTADVPEEQMKDASVEVAPAAPAMSDVDQHDAPRDEQETTAGEAGELSSQPAGGAEKEIVEPSPSRDADVTATEPVGTPTKTPVQHTADKHKKVAFAQPAPTSSVSSAKMARASQRAASPPPPSAAAPGCSLASSPSPPHAANTDAASEYTRAEVERIAAAAAALTPTTVLSLFRRGGDNSHTNRMEAGSYSRYLLSTDHMPPAVLDETFHGEQPTVGTVPRNTVKLRSGAAADNEEDGEALQHQQTTPFNSSRSSGFTPPSAAVQRVRRSPSSIAVDAAATAGAQMSTTWNSTAGSGTLRREVEMLDVDAFARLDEVRQRRRQDPRKGKPIQPQLDYVYYNHKSKGFYVPHDPSPDTTMLQYNHMYSFGDGTRFAPFTTSPSAAAGQQQRVDGVTGMYRRNPHSAPPRTFAETRGCVFPLTASQRQQSQTQHHVSSCGGTAATATRTTTLTDAEAAQRQRRRLRADIQNGTSSLRTAKAIDLSRLHRTQCPRPRTIEDVLANQQQSYLYSKSGTPHPLVQDIKRDVQSGKLEWEEVPASFQTALTAAAAAAAAGTHCSMNEASRSSPSQSSYPRPASAEPQQHRTASLSKPLNGLVDVMGHLRPVPAIAAATTTRNTNAASTTLDVAPTAVALHEVPHHPTIPEWSAKQGRGDGAAPASPLPAISRLNYVK
jgi:hypothetical protein